MRYLLLLALLSAPILGAACESQTSLSVVDRLRAQLDEDWRFWMTQYPELATSVGYPGQNARWTDYSRPAIDTRAAYLKASLERLTAMRRRHDNQEACLAHF